MSARGAGIVAVCMRGLLACFVLAAGFGPTLAGAAPCEALGRDGRPVRDNQDALARLLAARTTCPPDVHALRTLIQAGGGRLTTTFVGNRGFHNPGNGSFSLFEIVTGELAPAGAVQQGQFFFGHFTRPGPNGTLALDQDSSGGSLMIEAVVWDPAKGFFNFYELRGNGTTGVWHYNGDSRDILADTELLHRRRGAGQPPIGDRLRCSSCHVNGGPIMKELAAPHNDWWRKARPLALGGRRPDGRLAPIFESLAGAEALSAAVQAGVGLLEASPGFRAARASRSLQEQLRPLFCPVELNLESDPLALDDGAPAIQVPSAFLVDPRLAQGAASLPRDRYLAALQATGSSFPEIAGRRDADHAWLGPVKAATDRSAVKVLAATGLIDEEFESDVLAVDFTNPALSEARCRLLRFLPEQASGDWRASFASALTASGDAAALELHRNLREAGRNAAFHRERARRFLGACAAKLAQAAFSIPALRLLGQRRAEVFANEISSNPRRQILEPGFRVIFPQQEPAPRPGALELSEACEVVEK